MLLTKLMPPSSARRLVERPRLTRSTRLDRSKVTLVRAPAGFGKTSLLAQWYEGLRSVGARVGWLSFDAADRDAHEVLAYVVRAFECARGSFPSSVHELLRRDGFTTVEAIVASIVNVLCRETEPLYVFLDDMHVLRVAGVTDALAEFIERMPGNVHLAIASREALPFPLARARAFGNVVEVTAAELRFSSYETAEFMAVAAGGRLDDAALLLLEGRVEGWIAGLQLAAIALENDANASELLEAISGRRWTYAEFFIEVVISQQSPELGDFLLASSLFDRFSPALCDAVLDSSASRTFLDEIESRGLFIFSLDGERRWYRYHHLFAEFLREEFLRRYPSRAREIHARASRWFASAGLPQDAFAHAIKAGDAVQAATILSERCHTMFYGGQLRMLLDSASQIPENVLADFPRVRLAQAWSLVLQWKFPQARSILSAVGIKLRERPENESTREAMLLLHCTMMLAQFEDDMPTVERQCARLLERFMDADAYLVGTYYTSLLYAERERFELRNVDRLDARARDYFAVAGSRFVLVWHQSIAGPTRFLSGDTAEAVDALRDGLDAAIATAGPSSPLASIPALLLAEVYYERNELDAARELLERYLPLASELGFVDQLVAGYVTSSRLQRLRGDERGSALTLQRGLDLATDRGFYRLTANLVAELMTQFVRSGRLDRAATLAATYDLQGAADAMLPREGTTTASEARAVAWAVYALAGDRTSDALAVAKAWQRFTEHAGAVRAQVRWGTIVAQILEARGDARGAERALLGAVTAAAAGRFVRTFLDLDSALPSLLGSCFAACSDPETPVERFGKELLAAARGRGGRTDALPHVTNRAIGAGALNVRELEIVKLVASGFSNRIIAQRLAMTEGTVKWYLHRAYEKVGARNRTQVVELARRSGLLP